MSRRRFDGMNCGIAQALEAFGDWWSLLIIRDAFFGVRRFAQFQKSLGISTNILTNRLEHLVEHGILERVDAVTHGAHYEYVLAECGRDLLPVLTALREWSDRWVYGPGNEPLVVRDARARRIVPRLTLRDADGRELGFGEVRVEPGPGATEETRKRFEPVARRRERQRDHRVR